MFLFLRKKLSKLKKFIQTEINTEQILKKTETWLDLLEEKSSFET